MKRPPRRTLYALIAVFLLFAIISVLVGTPIGIFLWVGMLAIIAYFAIVAYSEYEKGKERERESSS